MLAAGVGLHLTAARATDMTWNVAARWGERLSALLLLAAFCALQLAATNAVAQEQDSPQPYAFEITELNEGLVDAKMTPRLDTPRAALESFLAAIDAHDPASAAHVLNMNAVPADEQAQRAPDLAMMLAYVIHRHDLISWRDIPDTPDARVLPDMQSSVGPYSRRSIELGEIMLNARPVSISLHRYSVDGEEPKWLFSPSVVERIPQLFGAIRQGWLGDWVSLRQRLDTLGRPSLWEWSIVGGVTVASAAAWLAVFAAARLVSRRLSRRWGRWFSATAIPLATLVAALIFRIGVVHLVVLTGPVASHLDVGSEIVLLAAGAWLVLRLLAALTLWLSETFVVPLTSEDPENRRTKTNVYIVRRLGLVLVAILAIGYLLLSLGAFDTFGLSLLASAGVLGVVLAIAAQPLLGNMVAGLQIALSDPVRIGDVVVYNDHWGTVEDISFAHTVIRTAKETRLIVPHSEFLSRAFENWSKEGEPVRRIVKIAADYRIDVDLVRRKIGEIVQDDPRLAEPPLIEMVETEGDAVILWIWLMGTTAFTSWYLHNEVREKLIAFLRDHEEGLFLPRQRHLLVDKTASDFSTPPSKTV
jgi:small-conductance mechanosensitive channel